MSGTGSSPVDSASSASALSALRAEFDGGFALPPPPPPPAMARLLLVRVGDSELCLDLSELSGVSLMPPLLSLPGSRRELLGVVAVRGRILPVFDLAALLGLSGAAVLASSMRWMALIDDQLGFAFERLQAHIDAPLSSLRDAAARHVRRAVSIETGQRGIIDLRSLRDSLSRLDPPSPPPPATSSAVPASPQGSLS